MKTKIGYKEASSMIAIFSLGIFLIRIIPALLVDLSNGIWINIIVAFIITNLFYFFIRSYFEVFKVKDFFENACELFGNKFSCFIGIVFTIFIVIYTFESFKSYCDIISGLSDSITFKKVSLVLIIASFICAYFGIESLTRYSFLSLSIIYVILFFVIYCISGAFNSDNLLPFFGNDTFMTFTRPDFLTMFFIPLSTIIMSDYFKNKYEAKKCVLLSILKVFFISLVLSFIFSLAVPKDMISSSDPLLSVFYVSGSGEVFHRFEILIISLYTLLCVVSLSFGMFVSSHILTKITDIKDYKPFLILIGIIIYSLLNFKISFDLLYLSTLIMSVLTVFIVTVMCVFGKVLKNK